MFKRELSNKESTFYYLFLKKEYIVSYLILGGEVSFFVKDVQSVDGINNRSLFAGKLVIGEKETETPFIVDTGECGKFNEKCLKKKTMTIVSISLSEEKKVMALKRGSLCFQVMVSDHSLFFAYIKKKDLSKFIVSFCVPLLRKEF